MMRTLVGTMVMGLLAIGCGEDGSGLEGTKKVVDLSASEQGDLCDYTSEVEGGYGASKMCGDGITITVKPRAECVANLEAVVAGCTATVADVEACAEAVGEDLCKLLSEPKCGFLVQCTGG